MAHTTGESIPDTTTEGFASMTDGALTFTVDAWDLQMLKIPTALGPSLPFNAGASLSQTSLANLQPRAMARGVDSC